MECFRQIQERPNEPACPIEPRPAKSQSQVGRGRAKRTQREVQHLPQRLLAESLSNLERDGPMRNFMIGCIALITATLIPSLSSADGRARLLPGIYQAGQHGCSHPTGAGALVFNGTNFSGEHQFCKTTKMKGKGKFHLNCMDLQGLNLGHFPPTAKEFVNSKENEKVDLTIVFTSKKSFLVNGGVYRYCGGLK